MSAVTKLALKELRTDAAEKVTKLAQNKRRTTRKMTKVTSKVAPKTNVVERIVGKKKIKGRVHYPVKWKGHGEKGNTYERATRLVEDGFKSEIDAFNRKISYLWQNTVR